MWRPGGVPIESRIMMFVDGENLANRYGAMLGDSTPVPHVKHEPGVYAWTPFASMRGSIM